MGEDCGVNPNVSRRIDGVVVFLQIRQWTVAREGREPYGISCLSSLIGLCG